MYELNYLRVLVLICLISRTYSVLQLNNLQEKLVLHLLKVKPKTNLVASALLLRFPLCKLASVATGDAKQELMTVLGYKDEVYLNTCYTRLKESVRTMAQADLTLVNRIYVNYTDEIDPMFFVNSTEKYGVQVDKVGFNYPKAAVSYINRMVSAGTFNRIMDILDPNDVNKNTMMVIVAGAHFKGTWEFPFDYRLTKLMKFRHHDGRLSRVPMMAKIDSFSYFAAGDCELLTMKFGSWRASITFVVPKTPQGLPDLLDKMQEQPNYINNMLKWMKPSLKRVYIPRFKIKTYVDWTGFLQELGLYSIFDKNSTDLAGILKKDSPIPNMPLSKVKQKLFIQIDELGVARFKIDPTRNRGPPKLPIYLEVPTFSADRPFYFEITLDFENARFKMFTGVYYGPEAEPVAVKH